MNKKGFTLLEVVIAVLILAVSLTAIIKIFTNYIRDFSYLKGEIKDIQEVKRYMYDIKEENKNFPAVETKTESYKYSLIKKIYIYKGKPVLFYYEK